LIIRSADPVVFFFSQPALLIRASVARLGANCERSVRHSAGLAQALQRIACVASYKSKRKMSAFFR
jgi:hypothetical protein